LDRKKIRIVLINPPYFYFPYNKKLYSNYRVPPLGIAYLAGAIRKAFPEKVEIIVRDDLNKGNAIISDYKQKIIAMDPDIVGFSVNTGTVHWVKTVAAAIREQSPKIQLIMGGVHATLLPEDLFETADAIFTGDAEFSIVEYIEKIIFNGGSQPIAGVYFKDHSNQEFLFGGVRESIEDLDLIPPPAFDLFDLRSYYHLYPYPGTKGLASLISSRGCPYACKFCSNEALTNSRMRVHSIGRVLEDINNVVETGTNLVFFHDDTFTYNKQRAIKILRAIKNRFKNTKIICHTRADHIDEELAYEMAQNNCVEVQIGVESGVELILKEYDKRLNLEKINNAFFLLRKYKINTWATFIFGAPSETLETAAQTIKFAKKINPTYASFIVLLPLPKTFFFDLYDKKGWLITKDWRHYSWHGNPIIQTDNLSPNDLIRLRRKAFSSFYIRPNKLIQLFIHTLMALSFKEIKRDFYAFLSFFKKIN